MCHFHVRNSGHVQSECIESWEFRIQWSSDEDRIPGMKQSPTSCNLARSKAACWKSNIWNNRAKKKLYIVVPEINTLDRTWNVQRRPFPFELSIDVHRSPSSIYFRMTICIYESLSIYIYNIYIHMIIYGGFLKWGYPQILFIFLDFPWNQPSSYTP